MRKFYYSIPLLRLNPPKGVKNTNKKHKVEVYTLTFKPVRFSCAMFFLMKSECTVYMGAQAQSFSKRK